MDADMIYDHYFKSLVERPDGTLDMEALKNELHDLFLITVEYGQIYALVTDGFLANGLRNHYGDEIEEFLRRGE